VVTVGAQALVFRAGAHMAALPVGHVTEVMRPLSVEVLAGVPPYVCGICVVRGRPVPVVDLSAVLGDDQPVHATSGPRTRRFVGVRAGTQAAVLAVDQVLGVRDLPLDQLYDLSSVAGPVCSSVGAVGDEPLLLLSVGRVVPDAMWEALEAVA
jgi:chemotaxis signal transduction protein